MDSSSNHNIGKQPKRARLVQQTLERFVKKPKLVSIQLNEQMDSLLLSLPDDVLEPGIFSHLPIEGLTDLASTCKYLAMKIDQYRGPLPYIIRHEILTKKLVYESREGDDNDAVYFNMPFVEVSQSQSIRFLLKTKCRRVVQVNLNLENMLWEETYVSRGTRLQYWNNRVDSDTFIGVKVLRKTKYRDGSCKWSKLLCSGDENYLTTPEGDEIDFWDEFMEVSALKKHVEDDVRDCFYYYWMCATKAIAIAPQLCPTIQYFMSTGPFDCNHLLQFVPEQYDVQMNPQSFGERVALDRKVKGLIRHRQPTSYIEWRSYAFSEPNSDRMEYEIHDISWFQSWYPKPTQVFKSNVLASVQKNFEDGLLPHLSFADLASLSVACPGLSARALCSLKDLTTDGVDGTSVDARHIALVMGQTGCSYARAARALRENDNDLVESIMSIVN